jgi:hypothetical protein
MTPTEIAKGRELSEYASPRPWRQSPTNEDYLRDARNETIGPVALFFADQQLVLFAVNNLASAMDEIERLRAGLLRVESVAHHMGGCEFGTCVEHCPVRTARATLAAEGEKT